MKGVKVIMEVYESGVDWEWRMESIGTAYSRSFVIEGVAYPTTRSAARRAMLAVAKKLGLEEAVE